MTKQTSLLLLRLALGFSAYGGLGAGGAFAQEPLPPPEPPPPSTSPARPDAATSPQQPAAEPPLRRIDDTVAPPVEVESRGPEGREPRSRRRTDWTGRPSRYGHEWQDDDFPFGNHTVPEGKKMLDVVSIFGSTTVDGGVRDVAFSFNGSTLVNGTVGGVAGAVFGDVVVNGASNEVFSVFGDVRLGPNAEVDGNVRVIFGTFVRDPGSRVHGSVTDFNPFSDPRHPVVRKLRAWVNNCLLWGRPYAIGPDLRWLTVTAMGILLFYILLAIAMAPGIERCSSNLLNHPGKVFWAGMVSTICAPIVIVLLAATGVGVLVLPFIFTGLIFASIYGRAVVLATVGHRFARFLGPMGHVSVSVLFGGVVIGALYCVPFFGFLVWSLVGFFGFGAVMYTLLAKPRRAVSPPEGPLGDSAATGSSPRAGAKGPANWSATPPSRGASAGFVSPAPVAVPLETAFSPGESTPPAADIPPVEPLRRVQPSVGAVPDATALLPRATFWQRMAALALDGILMAIILGPIGVGEVILPALAIYAAAMWKMKGTTIGGIICGLKVVRLDDRPIDWPTAIARALGCFLSAAVLLLGFIWIAYDRERQGWHDKVAGTVVVKLSKGVPLV